MRRLVIYPIFILSTLVLSAIFHSCNDVELPGSTDIMVPDGERIILEFMPSDIKQEQTRATDIELKGTVFESEVEKLDIFVFNKDGKIAHKQNVSFTETYPNKGTIVLDKSLKSFTAGESYTLYLIANAAEDSNNIETLEELLQKTERNENIHLTAEEESTTTNTKKRFVMHGKSDPVVLNQVNNNSNINVEIPLIRNAVKVILRLKEGKKTEGTTEDFFEFAGNTRFRFANMQATTRYIDPANLPADNTIDTEMTLKCVDESGLTESSPKTIEVVTYTYPNKWDKEVASSMTHLVVDLPYKGQPAESGNFYSIPITDGIELKANHIYTIETTINAAGSTTEYKPEEISGRYGVEEWGHKEVNIGGGTSPHYLTFDKDYLLMRGITLDSIGFASSHELVVTLDNAYFYNKYGNKIITNDENDKNLLYIWKNSNDKDNTVNIQKKISEIVTWKDYRGGFVHINCPLPFNNLPHRIEFTVKHKNCGHTNCPLKATVVIEQYPTEYISSYFGWYSYRDDFISPTEFNYAGDITYYEYPLSETDEGEVNWKNATSIENIDNKKNVGVVRLYLGPKVIYDRNGDPTTVDDKTLQWSYRTKRQPGSNEKTSGPGFFKSKVAMQPEDKNGKWWWTSYWADEATSKFTDPIISLSQFGWRDGFSLPLKENNNPRIYQINITSSKEPEYKYKDVNNQEISMDYDVTQPRLDENGYTDTSRDNLRLVSPAFAVASRLGAVTSKEDITVEDRNGINPKDDDGKPIYKGTFQVFYLDPSNEKKTESYKIAQEHCARYVEVYKVRDKYGNLTDEPDVVLKDWRLPTPAELRILIYYQGQKDTNPDAMDYQLPANYFWTADPDAPVYNWNHDGGYNTQDVGLRCVHDMTNIKQ